MGMRVLEKPVVYWRTVATMTSHPSRNAESFSCRVSGASPPLASNGGAIS